MRATMSPTTTVTSKAPASTKRDGRPRQAVRAWSWVVSVTTARLAGVRAPWCRYLLLDPERSRLPPTRGRAPARAAQLT